MTNNTLLRETNDRIRLSGDFGPGTQNPLMVTPGVQELGPDKLAALYTECMTFTDFDSADDPFDLHDFGVLRSCGIPVWFKFDPSPENAELRIVTFLLPDEN